MNRGFSSLPVVLLLSVVLACGTVLIGISGLRILQRNLEKQKLIEDFYRIRETIHEISNGGERVVQIRSSGKIILRDRLIEAWLDEEIVRSSMLPVTASSITLVYGDYLLSVDDNSRLEVKEWKH
ncbi:MAG: hypothetical protein QXU01_00245 [Candidatus Hadarchaeales archaeon]